MVRLSEETVEETEEIVSQDFAFRALEADDVDAEVGRLVALGARTIEKVHTWCVMEAPSGHRFCVVRQQRKPFGPHLNRWA